MICVGDTKIKNLMINHLIWLLINGSQKKLVVIGISQILIYEKSDISQNSESIKNNSFRVIFSPKICKNCTNITIKDLTLKFKLFLENRL
jgi:hypothetical protein